MPVTSPPEVALQEFLGSTTRHIRRVEIYESDSVTRWTGDQVARLKDGSVSVDYTRDERRALDLTLDNSDAALINAPGEFWYDKILKVYRGVIVREAPRLPKVLVIADSTTEPHSVAFRATLVALGFGDVRINTTAAVYSVDVAPYDIIVALGGVSKATLLNQAYQAGKSVFVFREQATPFYDAVQGNTTWAGTTSPANSTAAPRSISDPRTLGWTAFPIHATADTYKAPAVTLAGIFGVSFAVTTANYTITSGTNTTGGKFTAVHFPLTAAQYDEPQFSNFMLTMLNWLNPVQTILNWETQVGEFMIDRIVEPNRPRELKITGRDYTKKCMLSKFSGATQFAAGQTLEGLISVISANAGIIKKILPVTGIVIGQTFAFDRNSSRWDAMKQICTAYNYEIFFDATGYLVIRPYRDPSTTTPVLWLGTGPEGQIVKYTKNTGDSQLFNHILVSGESSDASIPPVYAESLNTDDTTNTSINKIGDRYFEYSSPFITTVTQAQTLADTYLRIYSLEEFSLDFDTLLLPWLEVGDILGFTDPFAAPGDPTTFLLSTLNIPLGLAPMSSNAKRTVIVGASSVSLKATTTWSGAPNTLTWDQVDPKLTWNNLP